MNEMNEPKCIEYDIVLKVKNRKYDVDTKSLVEMLRNHRREPIESIAGKMDVPKTLAEHWFRADKYNAIPLPEYWYKLKDILGIETDLYDESIMTFEISDSAFDMRNRCYSSQGICPTLKANTEGILITDERKRKADSSMRNRREEIE